jgi:hypothetical protein
MPASESRKLESVPQSNTHAAVARRPYGLPDDGLPEVGGATGRLYTGCREANRFELSLSGRPQFRFERRQERL